MSTEDPHIWLDLPFSERSQGNLSRRHLFCTAQWSVPQSCPHFRKTRKQQCKILLFDHFQAWSLGPRRDLIICSFWNSLFFGSPFWSGLSDLKFTTWCQQTLLNTSRSSQTHTAPEEQNDVISNGKCNHEPRKGIIAELGENISQMVLM